MPIIRNCSTQTALHKIMDDLAINIGEGKMNAVFSLDIAKGFDTVSPSVLLHKRRFYGFNEHSLGFSLTYLVVHKSSNLIVNPQLFYLSI